MGRWMRNQEGINAFLMKEKRDNPFYQSNFVTEKPSAPQWLNKLQLPRLDFVEVYGQSDAPIKTPPRSADVTSLYRQLDDAIESEQYDAAAAIKARIDELLVAEARDPDR